MMYSPPSTDIVVRILPSRSAHEEPAAQTRLYDSFVYTQIPLDIGRTQTRSIAEEFQGLPLQGAGQLRLQWRRYQDHLASFYEGEKGIEMMYSQMRETLSPEMINLVDKVRSAGEPWRVWWASDAPELDDLPWDILFYGFSQRTGPARFTCVRGAPPVIPPPILPLTGPLRLLWYDNELSPEWVRRLFRQFGFPGIQAVPYTGDVREGIATAVADGIELMHVCSDGIVSLAYEGVLYQHGDRRPELSAHELSERLRGSRVSVIGLTAQEASNPDVMNVNSREVVSVYRAFACFGSSRVPLPSIVAPLGPSQPGLDFEFWRAFYTHLGASHRLDRALAEARYAAAAAPYAVFLRHAHRKLFRAATTPSIAAPAPERMAFDLGNSLDVTTQVRALGEKYGALPDYLSRFAEQETEHQKTIEAELDVWSRPEGDES